MARIPGSELERLAKEMPIERVVSGFGVEPQANLRTAWGLAMWAARSSTG